MRRRLPCAAIALGVCAVAGAAAAADDAANAAAHFKEGKKLYTVGEYRTALEEFKQAFLAKEDPVYLYNIAQCHRQLGDNRQAVTFYRRYLAAAPQDPKRAEIERMVRDLEAKAAATPEMPPPAPGPAADPVVPARPPVPTPAAAAPGTAAPAPVEGKLHFEAALGAGGLRDDFDWLNLVSGSATGGSGAAQIALGYRLLPRFALGGLLALEWVQKPHIDVNGKSSDDVRVGALSLFGVFADWDSAGDGPAGLHFQAALGGSRMTLKDTGGTVKSHEPVGGGAVFGCGYNWPWRGDWQIGALGRLTAVTMSDEGVTHRVEVLSILASLSYR